MVGRRSLPSDVDDDAQRLRSHLLQCTSRDIVPACQAVEAQLQNVGGERVRDFYRLCFPILLRKIFGFEDSTVAAQPSSSAGGWLAQASLPGNDAAARALISLLSPRGTLFSSLLAADKENFVRYVFPTERLPEWVRRLLLLEKGAPILCQVSALFKNRITEDATGCMQVHLDVFEYYMFWFAYYAVCKDPNSSQGAVGIRRGRSTSSRSAQLRTQIESWASSIPRLHHSPQAIGAGGSPYLQLLKLYLSHFVVFGIPSKGYLGRDLQLADGGVSHGDILIHTLVEFWLVDDDPSPLPLAIRQSLGFQTGGTSTVLTYIPPGTDLTDSMKVLIKFLNSNLRSSIGEHLQAAGSALALEPGLSFRRKLTESPSGHFAFPLSPSPPPSPAVSMFPSPAGAYSQTLQRPFYRFLLRAFRLWPMGTPVRKMSQVVDVWLGYLEPWNTGLDAANARQQAQRHWPMEVDNTWSGGSPLASKLSPSLSHKQSGDLVSRSSRIAAEMYSEHWQGYVMSNYLYYTSLVTHFLESALKFVHTDPEAIFQMIYKVLSVLARSKELLDLLRKIDVSFAGHLYGRPLQRNNILLDLAPTIQDQLQDWEDCAGMNEDQERGDGLLMRSLSQRGKPAHLRLFSMSDNGANRILQALFMRAEVEIQASSSEKPPLNAHALEALKDVARKIFDLHTAVDSPSGSFQPGYYQGSPQPDSQNGSMTTRPSGLQRHSWQDVKYRGDWMRRPIESTEIQFLARLFVRLSDYINSTLGLINSDALKVTEVPLETQDQGQTDADQAQPVEVDVPSSSGQNEMKLSEILDLIKGLLWQFLLILQLEARTRGWRVNLRFMAEKKFLVLSTLAVLLYWTIRVIASCISPLFNK